MKLLGFMICACICLYSFAQEDSTTKNIDLYAYSVDCSQNAIDSFRIRIDSVQVDVRKFIDKIVTVNYFKTSRSLVTITYYVKNCKVIQIKTQEQSPLFSDLHNYSVFFLENGNLIDEKYYHSVRPCMILDTSKTIYEVYGYNPSLNGEFLKKYTTEVLKEISLHLCDIQL